MTIKDRYSRTTIGPVTINRKGLFTITSITVKLPFKKKWEVYKR